MANRIGDGKKKVAVGPCEMSVVIAEELGPKRGGINGHPQRQGKKQLSYSLFCVSWSRLAGRRIEIADNHRAKEDGSNFFQH